MVSLIEHVEHYDCARPYVNRFGVGRPEEYFRSHVQQSSTLSLDVRRVMDLELGRKAEVHNFEGGEVSVIVEQDVLYLIKGILAWL